MRKKLLNNNLTGAISKGGVLYRAGELPTLTTQQKEQAKLVSRLPNDFPFADWEGMTTKQQLRQMQNSGLNAQEQWSLLNTNIPLVTLNEHNHVQTQSESAALAKRVAASLVNTSAQATAAKAQAAVGKPTVSTPLQTTAQQRKSEMKQEEYETREYATKIVTTLMNTVSQTAAAKAQAAAAKPSNSTPLQNNGLRQKLDLLKEGFEKPPLGKASGGTGGAVPIKGTVEAGVGSAITNPDSSPKGFPFQFAAGTQPPTNTPGKTPAPTPTPTQLPQPGASPIIPVRTPTPFPANAECAYVFYTDTPGADFSKQAEYQKKALEKQGYRVKIVCVTNATTFSNAWNSMDPKTAAAVIISHCNGMSLIFEEGSSTNAISATGFGRNNNVLPSISSLEGPDVDEVYLYACNAGHEELLEEKGTNVADAFRDLPNIDTVYAYDGSVGFGIPIIRTLFPDTLFPHLSGEQDGYYDVFKNFNLSNEGASPSGLEIYYSEDEGDD